MQESLYLNLDKTVGKTVVDFFATAKAVPYKKGEVITRSDGPNYYAFCSKSGIVISYSISPKGHRDIHMISGPHTMFPLSNFWIPEEAEKYLPARTVYFEALTDCQIWQVTEQAFGTFIWDTPEAQQALFKQFCLNHRIHMTRVEMMQIRDVQLQLICLLLILGMNIGYSNGQGCVIEAPLSHQILADSLSVARETVSRELAKLKEARLVDYSDSRLVLRNITQLKEMVEDY